MKRTFKEFEAYIRLYDGPSKPRIDFQLMYKLFPDFEFITGRDFGKYSNFGEAFENKNYDMTVRDENGNECQMVYREYYDIAENLAYVS